MDPKKATAEVFWTAFCALSKKERGSVLGKMLNDREFLDEIVDTVILEKRRKEPSRTLESYLTDRRHRRH